MRSTRKMNKVTKTGLTFSLLGSILISGSPILAFAETSEEIAQEKKEVDENIEKIKEDLKKTEEWIESLKQSFSEVESEIKELNVSIKETENRIDKRKEILGNRLSAMQRQGGGGVHPYIEVIIEAENFTDFFNRTFAISKIIDADHNLIEQQNKDKKLLELQKDSLVKKKEELKIKFQQLQEEYEKLETQKTELETLSLELAEKYEEAKAAEERARLLRGLQSQSFEKFSITPDTFSSNEEVSETAFQIIKEASKYLGMPYAWGGASPQTSFDCSGLVQWSFKQAGVNVPRTSAQQYLATQRISIDEVKPGDLVFFSYGKGIAHVGIYIGNGKMIQSSNSGVNIANLAGYWEQYIAGFGRVAGVN